MTPRTTPYSGWHPTDQDLTAYMNAFAQRLLAEVYRYRRTRRMHTNYGHRRGHR